jgi:hypothetical protein
MAPNQPKEHHVSTMSIRRVGIALLAAASLSAATASLPAVSHAEPNNGGGTGKSCKLPGGKTISDGTTGTDYGSGAKTYECNDGIACQVEGGKTTDKCSHTATIIKVTRGNRVQGTATVSARF